MSTAPPCTPVITFDQRAKALRVAARSGADVRTVIKALDQGVEVIRTLSVREAVRRAIAEEPT